MLELILTSSPRRVEVGSNSSELLLRSSWILKLPLKAKAETYHTRVFFPMGQPARLSLERMTLIR